MSAAHTDLPPLPHPASATATSAPARPRARRRALLRLARQVLLWLVALAAALAGVYAFRPRPVPIDVGSVSRGALSVEVRESGMTRVKDRYVVSAPVSGNLLRISLEANDTVAEGQALALLAPLPVALLDERARAEAEARLAATRSGLSQAQAQMTAKELAERELDRSEKLRDTGVIALERTEQAQFEARLRTDELSSAVFASKVAAEEVRLARASLVHQRGAVPHEPPLAVLAPVSGHVLRVQHESAGVTTVGTPLLELGDLSRLEVVVDLLTTDAVQIAPGTAVSIEGWGGARALAGRVRKVELAGFTRPSALGVDEQRANVWIRISDPREHWATLGDGYRVEVRLVTWASTDVVKAPQSALFRRGDTWAAFRVESGVARLVPIRIGHRGETEVEVVSGLTPGDQVVVSPGDRVEDGVRVAAR
jgi:HlyD family secretion protein